MNEIFLISLCVIIVIMTRNCFKIGNMEKKIRKLEAESLFLDRYNHFRISEIENEH